MNKYYEMEIAGLKRKLPICKINDQISIACFIMFGDVEMTVACAAELLKKCPEFDFILTPEAKSIPLAYEMARQSGKKYFVARKVKKLYMSEPVAAEVRSITTEAKQTLYLDSLEGEQMRGKRTLIIDDVISTGESLSAVVKLAEQFQTKIIAKAAVLAEGSAAQREDIIFLATLPLLYK